MALMLRSPSSSFRSTKPQFLHPKSTFTKPYLLSVNSTTEPPTSTQSDDDTSPIIPSKKPNSAGLGFGPPPPKQQQKSKKQRASIIRREPLEKPAFVPQKVAGESTEQGENEKAFLLAWAGLGSIIIVQGLLLSASGFLPEKWDNFFVKYLYPSFTPTVFLFIAGTVVYGLLKYKQNEASENPK